MSDDLPAERPPARAGYLPVAGARLSYRETGRGQPIILLDSFIDTVPRDLWITSLEQKETQLKLSGTAFSTAAVSDFMSNLKSSGKFKDVEIVVSRQALDKTPSLVTFEVTCKFEG